MRAWCLINLVSKSHCQCSGSNLRVLDAVVVVDWPLLEAVLDADPVLDEPELAEELVLDTVTEPEAEERAAPVPVYGKLGL